MLSPAEFWQQVDRTGDGCWLWTGKTLKRPTCQYGYFWDAAQRKTVHAHRRAWELTHGAIPADKHVLHRCDNALCMRHLFLGTHLDNMRDMVAKGRRSPDCHRKKGVPFTAEHRANMSAARRRRETRKRKAVA